jgi:hypothetical protein
MLSLDLIVEPANVARELDLIMTVRNATLSPESCLALALDDTACWHVIAWNQPGGSCVGAARVHQKGALAGMIDGLCALQTQALSALLRAAMELAQSKRFNRVWLADLQYQDIAQALGFTRCGGQGAAVLEHVFAISAPVVRAVELKAMNQTERHPQLIGGKTSADLHAASLQIIHAARRELCIYSFELDPKTLDQLDVLAALRTLALRSQARVRILLQNPQRAAQDGHRLVELARRLSSVFAFRMPLADDLQFHGAFILNDDFGFIARDLASRFECEGNLYDIGEHGRLKRYFDEVWERAGSCTELRRLSL